VNLRYQLPESINPMADGRLDSARDWLMDQSIELTLVPIPSRLSINPKAMTVSFFGYVRNADGKLLHQGGRPKRKRMTFPITALPPAEIGELVAS
jgi:hypothetical protein